MRVFDEFADVAAVIPYAFVLDNSEDCDSYRVAAKSVLRAIDCLARNRPEASPPARRPSSPPKLTAARMSRPKRQLPEPPEPGAAPQHAGGVLPSQRADLTLLLVQTHLA